MRELGTGRELAVFWYVSRWDEMIDVTVLESCKDDEQVW